MIKQIITYMFFIMLCCTSCTYYGNAVNNTTDDSIKRIEIYNKNAENLNSINVSAIQKQAIIEDTVNLNEQQFAKYCNIHNISSNIIDWQQLNCNEYESGKLMTMYTTFNNDTVFRLKTTTNNNVITYNIIRRILKNI